MRRGLLYESSFAFTVEDDEWTQDGDVHKRSINKIGRLFDVSIVGIGAYANTDVALRALEQIKEEVSEIAEEVVVEQVECDSEETLNKIELLQKELTLKSKL